MDRVNKYRINFFIGFVITRSIARARYVFVTEFPLTMKVCLQADSHGWEGHIQDVFNPYFSPDIVFQILLVEAVCDEEEIKQCNTHGDEPKHSFPGRPVENLGEAMHSEIFAVRSGHDLAFGEPSFFVVDWQYR